MLHSRLGQCLGQDVCGHVSSLDVLDSNRAGSDLLSKPVEAEVEVLHPAMVLGILGHLHCRLVVHVECGRADDRVCDDPMRE